MMIGRFARFSYRRNPRGISSKKVRVPNPVCKGCLLGVGREETERLMRALRVVVHDIIADGLVERRDRVRIAAVELLLLERREERFHDGIVCRCMRT